MQPWKVGVWRGQSLLGQPEEGRGKKTQEHTIPTARPTGRGTKGSRGIPDGGTSKMSVASRLQLLPQLHACRRLAVQGQSDLEVPAVEADGVPQPVVDPVTCGEGFPIVRERRKKRRAALVNRDASLFLL